MAQRTRSQRLNGLFPLSYTGVVPVSPVNFVIENRPPTTQDFKNFYIGDLWLDRSTNTPPTNSDVWMLVSVTNNVATWVHFGSGGAGFLHTLTGNSGGPVPPDVNDNIDVIGDVNVGITIAGNAGTNTLTVTTVSGNRIGETITGDSGGAVPFDAGGNINLVGGTDIDVTGNPGTNTLTIDFTGSGTGASDFVTDDGTATEVGGVINIITNHAVLNCGSSVLFSGSGNTVLLDVTDADNNTLIGREAGNAPPLGGNNTSLGYESLTSLTSGNENVAIGSSCLANATTAFDTVAVGVGALRNLVSGGGNIAIGVLAGTNYTGAETGNILINDSGVVGESHTIRIGGPLASRCFIEGIAGVTVSNQQSVVIDTTTGQLGSTAISDSGAHDFVTDSGTAQEVNGVINIITDNAAREAGKSVLFTGLGDSVQLHMTDVTNNTFIGRESGGSLSSGSNNTAVGTNSLTSHTSGSSNASLGVGSLFDLTSGSNNVAIGGGSLQNLVSGMGNIAVGESSGDNYTSNESANIVIGNPGQLGDGNTIRIGSGTHTRCFIEGIAGVTVSNQQSVVIDTTTGQLGSTPVSGGGGVLITTFTSSGTWNKNASTQYVEVIGWSGGGGGGSGQRSSAFGGGGGASGGGGGGMFWFQGPAIFFGASESVVIGAGGSGAAAITTNNTGGSNGAVGGNTEFGNMICFGGLGGLGGQSTDPRNGVPGQSHYDIRNPGLRLGGTVPMATTGSPGTGSWSKRGGGPNQDSSIMPTEQFNDGTSAGTWVAGSSAGGGGGASTVAARSGTTGQPFVRMDNTTTLLAGGSAGIDTGSIDGGNGNDQLMTGGIITGGTGGGGGGGQFISSRGGNGGNGGFPGGGGGGGGGSLNDFNSGAGGDGGDGMVMVIEYLG